MVFMYWAFIVASFFYTDVFAAMVTDVAMEDFALSAHIMLDPVQTEVLQAVDDCLDQFVDYPVMPADFRVPVRGGFVDVSIIEYKHRSPENSLRDQAIDTKRLKDYDRYKVSIVVTGITELTSLAWLQCIGEDVAEKKNWILCNLYSISVGGANLNIIQASWFDKFKNLETLDLSGNNIVGFEYGNFLLPASLVELKLANNRLQSIPVELKLPWLESLDLSGNNIDRLFPRMFEGLINLNTLYLSNNFITDLPNDVFYDVGKIYSHFRLVIIMCNNPISNMNSVSIVEQNKHKLGFFKTQGNKIVFSRIDDGINTPQEICVKL